MNKALTLLALIGTSSAANTKLRDQMMTPYYQTFPNYADNVAGIAVVATVIGYSKLSTVFFGGYQCIRKGAIYGFPQDLTLTTTSFINAIAASNTALVTFYGADTDGTFQGNVAATAALDTSSATIELNSGCNFQIKQIAGDSTAGSVAANYLTTVIAVGASSDGTVLADRVFYSGNHNHGEDPTHMASGSVNNYAWVWNNDFLLASTWQKGAKAGGTASASADFCTIAYASLATAAATSDASATVGFDQQYKCTWEVEVTAAMGAPKFKVTAAKSTVFQLQWAEWESATLTAKTDLVDTSNVTPYYLGAVANIGTGSSWPNPVAGYYKAGVAASGFSMPLTALTDYSPSMDGYTQSPGLVKWFPSAGETVLGPNSAEAYTTMDFMAVKSMYDTYNGQKTTYESALSSYNTLKDAYNKALADEKTRQADFFKATFEPAVTIPVRPCQPTRLAALSGVDFKYTPAAALTADNKKASQGVFTFGDGVPAIAASWRVGYLTASTSTTFVTTDNVGHVYGLLGQAATSVTDTSIKGWQWKDQLATATHWQMVSILPYSALTALAGTETITVQFGVASWNTDYKSVSKPSQPGDSLAPDSASAKALAASAVAVAAIAASLF